MDKHLPTALLTTRACTNCGNGYSPFEMVYGPKSQNTPEKTDAPLLEPINIPSDTPALQEICKEVKIVDYAWIECEFLLLHNWHKVENEA